jgi:putative modified peptide
VSSSDRGGTAEARLLARLLTDDAFRAAFRRSPADACRSYGLEDVADELSAGSSMETMEVRESKSSLAGAVMALAAEGVGIGELAGVLGHRHEQVLPAGLGHRAALELPTGNPRAGGDSAQVIAHAAGAQPGSSAHPGASAAADGAGTDAVGGSVAGSSAGAELLANPRLSVTPQVRGEILQGNVDPRVVTTLQDATADHTVVLGDFQVVSDPVHAQVLTIVSVDGQPVGSTNVAARDLLTKIAVLDPSVRPTEVTSPWSIQAPGFFSDPSHPGQLRLSFVSATDGQPQGSAVSGTGAASDQGATATPAAPSSDAASSVAPQGAGAGANASSDGYVNPFPSDAQIGRTDMGVDVDLKSGEPIVAIGKSRVLGIMPGWYNHQPYLALQLLDGPLKGRNYYVAEQINPTVMPGQIVQAGQVIAHYAASGTGIEIGWAGPNWQQTLAQATSGYSEGERTPAGLSFH